MCHDITQRSKYAKNLLYKVRLPFLSIPEKKVLERVSSKCHEFANTIEANLVKKQQLHIFRWNITSRYCSQTNFNILFCGGENENLMKVSNDVKLFNANNFNEVISLPHMNESRYFFWAVYIKGEINVSGGNDGKEIEKYSPNTNTWKYLSDMIES